MKGRSKKSFRGRDRWQVASRFSVRWTGDFPFVLGEVQRSGHGAVGQRDRTVLYSGDKEEIRIR